MWTMDGSKENSRINALIISESWDLLQIILEYLVWDKLVYLHSHASNPDLSSLLKGFTKAKYERLNKLVTLLNLLTKGFWGLDL
jgi:hypothetical protein